MFPDEQVLTKNHLRKFERDFLKIECGDYTYGHPHVEIAKFDSPRILSIGRYCSIGPNVRMFVGRQGIHPTDSLSTYPIQLAVSAPEKASAPRKNGMFVAGKGLPENLNIVIGNDVWIGTSTIIMAGVTIGHGAVIGAGSVVTSDVPNFAVVVGSPARVLKFRHEDKIAEAILRSRWWSLTPEQIYSKVGENISSTAIVSVLDMLGVPDSLEEHPRECG